jgi:hypothetical protein
MTPDLPETDDELLIRMRSGDERAFVTLYRRRQAAIYRFALHMSGSATVAEDVTQEVFLALIREECGFDPRRGTLSGYLFGIARKLVLRHVERGRPDVALETDVESSALPELMVDDDPLADLIDRGHRGPAPLGAGFAPAVPRSGGPVRFGGSGLRGGRHRARLPHWHGAVPVASGARPAA